MTDQKLELTRVFDAPIEEVWKAWTTPEAWAQWYGKPGDVPKDSVKMDVRVGGKWQSTTIAGEDTIPFNGEYTEVERPHTLVLTFGNPEDPDVEVVTVKLKEVNGKTEMYFKQEGHLPPEEYNVGLRKGWSGFFDHLEKYLK